MDSKVLDELGLDIKDMEDTQSSMVIEGLNSPIEYYSFWLMEMHEIKEYLLNPNLEHVLKYARTCGKRMEV